MRTLAILSAVLGLLSQDAEKIKAALKTVGERTYKLTDEKHGGSLVLKTTVEKDAAILDDVLTLQEGEAKATMAFKQTCAIDACLNPTAVEGKITDGKENRTVSVVVKDGTAKVKLVDGAEVTERSETLGDKAITHFALFRVVCILEAKKDATVKFNLVDVEAFLVRKDSTLTCNGKDKTDVGGKAVECDQWTLKEEGRDRDSIFWVSGGVVVKATVEGVSMELVEKK